MSGDICPSWTAPGAAIIRRCFFVLTGLCTLNRYQVRLSSPPPRPQFSPHLPLMRSRSMCRWSEMSAFRVETYCCHYAMEARQELSGKAGFGCWTTSWFTHMTPNFVSHKCRMQLQLECHRVGIMLTVDNLAGAESVFRPITGLQRSIIVRRFR